MPTLLMFSLSLYFFYSLLVFFIQQIFVISSLFLSASHLHRLAYLCLNILPILQKNLFCRLLSFLQQKLSLFAIISSLCFVVLYLLGLLLSLSAAHLFLILYPLCLLLSAIFSFLFSAFL